ncbi:unnamed protein product [Adineta steineri]|uniref:Uncharacterized protein n=1 Tax=Adineta steineri TaxID=433720 RepID=A0A814I2T3_9BILA|nr:unnamed protein product [Adineta steineri]CAF1267056.1 unnamed protein product [Adineta steineri]
MDLDGLGEHIAIHRLSRQYFPNTQALIFIIDLYDNFRLEEATEELWSLLSENELKKLLLLIYLNKYYIFSLFIFFYHIRCQRR